MPHHIHEGFRRRTLPSRTQDYNRKDWVHVMRSMQERQRRAEQLKRRSMDKTDRIGGLVECGSSDSEAERQEQEYEDNEVTSVTHTSSRLTREHCFRRVLFQGDGLRTTRRPRL